MADFRHRQVRVGSMSFGLLEAGPDDGPLAICLHGFPDTAWTWRHLLPLLADAGYHAVAPFLRGYAPTELAHDGAYQVGALVSDACGLKEALAPDSSEAVVIGHDWGAMAAYGAGVLRPDLFRKVVAMAVPPPPAVAAKFLAYDNIKRSFYVFFFQSPLADFTVGADDCAFIDRLWADWSPGYEASWDLEKVKESIGEPDRLVAAISYYRHTFGQSGQLPQYEEAQRAYFAVPPQPTLYFHGVQDGCMSVDLASGAEDILAPGSEMVILEGAGHFLHLERPATVNEAVLGFLES
jgi:pimeloyl-ACP methyl ester carboxylesterase